MWYNTHIRSAHFSMRAHPPRLFPSVVLMTEDAINRQKAESERIPCVTGVYVTYTMAVGC
jgi:exosome complex exonuclease DIS3/RRP44